MTPVNLIGFFLGGGHPLLESSKPVFLKIPIYLLLGNNDSFKKVDIPC